MLKPSFLCGVNRNIGQGMRGVPPTGITWVVACTGAYGNQYSNSGGNRVDVYLVDGKVMGSDGPKTNDEKGDMIDARGASLVARCLLRP